jgi:hypothetical protein
LNDDMPIAVTHKGVGIHAGQPAKRVALVKREIVRVERISDLVELLEIACDVGWSPEARLFAAGKFSAGWQRSTELRQARPGIDPELVVSATAGLATVRWAHPARYCTLLDAHCERAAPRDEPLPDLE